MERARELSEMHDTFTASALNWYLGPSSQMAEPDSVGRSICPQRDTAASGDVGSSYREG